MKQTTPRLVVGNRNYSSWSLRPWLALRWAGIPFEDQVVQLGGEGYGQGRMPALAALGGAGRVPVLQLENMTLWDSLAICQWAEEQPGAASLLPATPQARWLARCAVAEMHSGFPALRNAMGMNIRRRTPARRWPPEVQADVDRVLTLWSTLRQRHEEAGPWLLGTRSVADAFFAPVVSRFRTYGAAVPPVCQAFMDTLLADADFRAWEAMALEEPWKMPDVDAI